MGILNTLHIRAYDDYYEEVVSVVSGPEGCCRASGLDPSRWLALVAGLSKKKPHILVVAPSNVAVDNIITRIMEKGFCDSKESTYYPSMLRVGSGSGISSSSGGDGGRKSPANPTAASATASTLPAALDSSGNAARAVSLEETVEKEQLSAMSEESRAAAMETVSAGMRDLIAQLWSVQAALLNMGTAFKDYPLPKGWELRCDQESSRPYWVDHRSQTVHMEPPREEQYDHRAVTPPLPPSSSSSVADPAAPAEPADPRLRRKQEKEHKRFNPSQDQGKGKKGAEWW